MEERKKYRIKKNDMVKVIAGLLLDSENRLSLANAAAIAIDGAIVRAQLESKNTAGERESLRGLAVLLAALENLD